MRIPSSILSTPFYSISPASILCGLMPEINRLGPLMEQLDQESFIDGFSGKHWQFKDE